MKNIFKTASIQKDRISDQIITVIEQAVLEGSLKQGTKLPTEEKIAAQFKVSKVAVREALREMEVRGLIRKARGKYGGNFVSAPEVNRVGKSLITCFQFGTLTEDEIIDFRQTLEPVLIKKAAHLRTKEDLQAMEANIKLCEKDLSLSRTRVGRHIEFHVLIAKACQNKLFVAVMEAIAEIFEDIAKNWQEDRKKMRLDIDFNHQFYDCILHRQADEAEKLMVKHFELTRAFRAEDFEKTWGKKTGNN